MRQAGEPTVDEILESIKQVIARDSRAPTSPPAGASDEADEDFGDVLDLSDAAALENDATPAVIDAPLLNETVQASMRDSLAALAMLSTPGAPPQIVRSGETSLEGLTRDLLRPMLAEWLDRNLPAMVERLVTSEIARIVGKKG